MVGRRELAKQSGVEILVSEGARHPIDPVHSLTTPSSRHHTTNVIELDARHVGLAPTHWRATPRPDGSNCLRAPATRILCQLLATIGAVTCALRETTPKRLTATGLALPSRYRIGSDFQQKRWCIVIRLRCSLARYAQCERDGAAVPRILTIARRSVSVQEN